MEDELNNTFGAEVEIALLPGSGGVFLVCADGKQLFSKKETGRFPEAGEIISLLR
ncbi:MAG: SelT/SelW/SelH family protein [Candidatus Electrothrix sp. AR4]|nr:SelT/SelW/SelH family protein [Candidatus Electrothrix sp. AR4]